ncbi:MAG: YvcK family protein, partial [Anaerolineae bacterium]|nr:YvcK family protein [Anaerolineae bacterium]
MTKITVLGGGTGSYVVLTGLKKESELDLAAIVTMADNGGSTGRLRDQLGVLPAGDLRQCLIALSDASIVWRKLFAYRFESGDLKGHNFGNILVSALEKVTDNYDEVLEEVHRIMNVKGMVIPVTSSQADIHIEYESGRKIIGEKLLDESSIDGSRIAHAYLIPDVSIHPDAQTRIMDSDYIIAGPGDLYSSIIAIAMVKGVKEAVQQAKAGIIFVMNLMTKSSQTKDYTAADHIRDFEK